MTMIVKSESELQAKADSRQWPRKHDIFGVMVSATDYNEATQAVLRAAQSRESAVVSLHSVHAVVTSSSDPNLRQRVNSFELVGPDGQPVRWALNLLHGAGLAERVYGPEFMLRLCHQASESGVSIYLYGGATTDVLDALVANLTAAYPGLIVAGAESPPFRALTEAEDDQVVRRINESGAGIVFIGLGCPKQDHFAYDHRERINAVQVCVGAAFDFHAGSKKMAPSWMQRRGLEWLFRLVDEPARLWRRYLVTNSLYVQKLLSQWVCVRLFPRRTRGAD